MEFSSSAFTARTHLMWTCIYFFYLFSATLLIQKEDDMQQVHATMSYVSFFWSDGLGPLRLLYFKVLYEHAGNKDWQMLMYLRLFKCRHSSLFLDAPLFARGHHSRWKRIFDLAWVSMLDAILTQPSQGFAPPPPSQTELSKIFRRIC